MTKLIFIFLIISCTLASSQSTKKEKIQRDVTQLFDNQFNSVSDVSFPVSNYGILFLNIAQNQGGCFWPRNTRNQYIFGGGFWFASEKWVIIDNQRRLQKLAEVTYNPNSGQSWMVPGIVEDGDNVINDDIKKYRVYFSTDMESDGHPKNLNDGPNWPLWKTEEHPFIKNGFYVSDISNRNTTDYPEGPAFISDEDIFSTYKDTDLSHFEGGVNYRSYLGYPLRLQIEQTILTWVDDDKKDMIIIYYKINNKSQDTLFDCWIAPIFDTDLATAPNTMTGAGNDWIRYYNEDESLNLGLTWSNVDRSEVDMGYLGVSMIYTPSVYRCDRAYDTLVNGVHYVYCAMCLSKDTISIPDYLNPGSFKDTTICKEEIMFPREKKGFLRDPNVFYPIGQQLGMKTFRAWPINDDIVEDEARYNYVSSQVRESNLENPGDYRMLFATGPVSLLPGESVYCAVQLNFAMPALGGDPTGETNDLTDLVEKVKLGQGFFYDEIISKVQEQEKVLNSSILIYPNPATDRIYIRHRLTGNINIAVYNILGLNVTTNVILNQSDVILSLSKDVIELNTETLNPGTYIMCISNEKEIISEKFTVIK